ncbi:MAG: RdgB/HAM1 family non-canonical purine NTP pyrophosphatase [Gammaproteobacteria bacterium]
MNNEVVLASGNKGKLRELREILGDENIILRSQSELGVKECPETGLTFVENAILKAQNAARQTNLPAIADDSGIVVDILDGAPGVYSARYAGDTASDEQNLLKLIDDFNATGGEITSCRFICLIVFISHARDPLPQIFQGAWEGELVTTPLGENGFGYDPIFWVPGHNCTSAQLPPAVKNKISHRAKALAKLAAYLRQTDNV